MSSSQTTALRLRRGILLLAGQSGQFTCIDGSAGPILPRKRGGRRVTRVMGKPDGNKMVAAVQEACAAVLRERGLEQERIELLTRRDQVWTALFEHRILAYNPTESERTVSGTTLAGRHILEITRGR